MRPQFFFQQIVFSQVVFSQGLRFLVLFSLVLTSSVFSQKDELDPFFFSGLKYGDHVLRGIPYPDGRVLIVGKFQGVVGSPMNFVARLAPNGNVDPTFNPGIGANAQVNTAGFLSDGRIVLGGDFTSFDGVPANRVVLLHPDGSVDSSFSVGAGPNLAVNDLVVQPGNQIVIVGRFENVAGQSVGRVARLNSNGTLDLSFQIGTGPNTDVEEIEARANGKLVIAGNFDRVGNFFRNRIAQLNSNGSLDTSFISGGPAERILAIAIQSTGKIIIGGEFGVMRVNASGGIDNTFNPGPAAEVTGIGVQAGDKLVLGGQFPSRGPGTGGSVIRTLADGPDDPTFEHIEFRPVSNIVISGDGKPIALGYMAQPDETVGGADQTGVKKFNDDGSLDTSYITRTGAAVGSVLDMDLHPDGKIVVLGDFNSLGGLVRQRVGRLLADGTVDYDFEVPVIVGTAGAGHDGTVVVGGNPIIGNRYNFYRLNPDGSIDPTFTAESDGTTMSGGFSNVLDIVVLENRKVYVAGSFEKINGVPRKGLARLNSDGSPDSGFVTPFGYNSGAVSQIKVREDGKIFVAGVFDGLRRLILLNPDGSVDTSFNQPFVGGSILDFWERRDGKILLCGTFNNVNGFPVFGAALLDRNGTVNTSFVPPQPQNTSGGAFYGAIAETDDGKILIGGQFSTVGGVARRAIVRLNQDGSVDPEFDLGIIGTSVAVNAILRQPDRKFLISGSFRTVSGQNREKTARLEPSDFVISDTRAPFDFDGDGATDVSVFRPNSQPTAQWWMLRSSDSGTRGLAFGTSTDVPVAADFTGDGKTDVAFWRPSSGEWFILRSEDDSFFAFPFGSNGDIPAPGDFDGDGKADPAVYRPSSGTWFIVRSSDGGLSVVPFGVSADKPIVADYDGDGKDDVGVYRAPDNQFWLLRSTDGVKAFQFGAPGDRTAVGDWTGDGKADVAFFRPSSSEWYVIRSEDDSFFAFPWGANGDIPSPGDFDGDGKFDPAVWRPSDRTWYIFGTTSGFEAVQFGSPGDVPLPSSISVN